MMCAPHPPHVWPAALRRAKRSPQDLRHVFFLTPNIPREVRNCNKVLFILAGMVLSACRRAP
jgi:hypothetical protein